MYDGTESKQRDDIFSLPMSKIMECENSENGTVKWNSEMELNADTVIVFLYT